MIPERLDEFEQLTLDELGNPIFKMTIKGKRYIATCIDKKEK